MSIHRSHDAAVFRRLAVRLAHSKDWPQAEEALSLSLRLDEQNAETWALLGALRASNNRHREAVSPYVEALKRAPTDIRTWTNLAEVYLALADYDKAAAAFEQAMRLDPDALHPAGRRARSVVAKTIRALSV